MESILEAVILAAEKNAAALSETMDGSKDQEIWLGFAKALRFERDRLSQEIADAREQANIDRAERDNPPQTKQ